ncbi:MAG: response regulator [Thermoanaerobaculia bacterium]
MPTRVLIADDDLELGRSLEPALIAAGFEVQLVADGAKALRLAHRLPHPAVVVTELVLPELDGFELTRRLRSSETTANIPVIMTSPVCGRLASCLNQLQESQRDRQPNAYLEKPFTSRVLIEQIQALLSARPAEQPQAPAPLALLVGLGRRSEREVRAHLTGGPERVRRAASREAALAALGQEEMDLILVAGDDASLAGFVSAARALQPDISLVVVTPAATEDEALSALAAGASDYLLEPLKPRVVELRLRENIARRQREVENRRLMSQLEEATNDLVAEIQRLARQVRRADRSSRAARSVKARQSELVTNLSHQIRNPITVIKGAIELVREAHGSYTADQGRLLLERASANVDRLVHLTDDLFDSRPSVPGRRAP